MVYKLCYENVFNGIIPSNADIIEMLILTSEPAMNVHATLVEAEAKENNDLIYVSVSDATRFRSKFDSWSID